MHLVVVGISHRTAPLELRERLALPCDDAVRLGRELLDSEHDRRSRRAHDLQPHRGLPVRRRRPRRRRVRYRPPRRGAAASSRRRCAPPPTAPATTPPSPICSGWPRASTRWWSARRRSSPSSRRPTRRPATEGCTNVVLNRLFRQAVEVGKRVRTETAIGERPVSVSSVAVDLARQELGTLDDRVVLVLGAGETSELAVKHLRAQGAGAVVVANRTLASAAALAGRCDGRAVCLDELDAELLGGRHRHLVDRLAGVPGRPRPSGLRHARCAPVARCSSSTSPCRATSTRASGGSPTAACTTSTTCRAWSPPTATSVSVRSPRPSASSTRRSRA